jgi:hypothetical protein
MQGFDRKLVTIIRNVIKTEAQFLSIKMASHHLIYLLLNQIMGRSYGISSVRYQPFNTNPQYYKVLKNTLAQK